MSDQDTEIKVEEQVPYIVVSLWVDDVMNRRGDIFARAVEIAHDHYDPRVETLHLVGANVDEENQRLELRFSRRERRY